MASHKITLFYIYYNNVCTYLPKGEYFIYVTCVSITHDDICHYHCITTPGYHRYRKGTWVIYKGSGYMMCNTLHPICVWWIDVYRYKEVYKLKTKHNDHLPLPSLLVLVSVLDLLGSSSPLSMFPRIDISILML